MKRCRRCGEEKSLEDFYKKTRSKDGRQACCKSCDHIRSGERMRANPQKHAASVIAWQARNKQKVKEARKRRMQRPDVKAKWAEYLRSRSASYAESYVRRVIARSVGCKSSEVPDALTRAKRSVLIVQKIIKEKA